MKLASLLTNAQDCACDGQNLPDIEILWCPNFIWEGGSQEKIFFLMYISILSASMSCSVSLKYFTIIEVTFFGSWLD